MTLGEYSFSNTLFEDWIESAVSSQTYLNCLRDANGESVF